MSRTENKPQKVSIIDENRSHIAIIATLVWPVLLEQILTSLVGYMDTAMVGSLGKNATAAVSISNSPMFLINGTIMAMGVGFTALISQAIGAEEVDRARKLMRQAIVSVLAIGIPISILVLCLARVIPTWMGASPDILDDAAMYNRIIALSLVFRTLSMILTSLYRGCGDTKTPMLINIGINLVNVVGNFFLIFPTRELPIFGQTILMPGAGWGVAGAAAATSISGALGAIVLLIITYTRKGPMQLKLRDDYRPDWPMLRSVLRISIPAALERVTMSSAGIISTRAIASLGTAAVAANSLALTSESISFMPAFAFGTAATTLVGQALGAKKPDLAQKFVATSNKIATVVMAIVSVALFLLAENLVSLFTPDAEVIKLGTLCLQISAIIQIPQAISSILSGGMRGAGDTKWIFIIMALSVWLVRLPITVIAISGLGFGLAAAFVAMDVEICVRCVAFYLRYRSGKWKTLVKL